MLTTTIKPGPVRLVFTMGWDPFQLLINVSTRSTAAHVAIGLGDHLLHAYEPGITLEPREEYLEKREQKLVAEYNVLPYVDDHVRAALVHIGQRGFWLGVFQVGFIRALRLCGSPLSHLFSSNERTCARFAMLLDPRGDRIPEWQGIHRHAVVPADLLVAAEAGPSFERVA